MNNLEFIKKVKQKEIDIIEHTHKIIEEAEKKGKQYFTTITKELALKQAQKISKKPFGKLAGLPISVKDSICVKNIETTAGSKILKGYKPVFNATIIKKALNEGAIIIGKTKMDEFGFGSFCTNINPDQTLPTNPLDKTRVTGGSSGGCAGITRITKNPHLSIAESTGGSIACPASFCGIIGFTPTYGLISRYGLIDYASSMDKIGFMSKNINDCQQGFHALQEYDNKDSTSVNKKLSPGKAKKIAIIDFAFKLLEPEIKENIFKKIDRLGIKYDTIKLPLTKKYSLPCYYILAMSEASTNLAKYCGMKYGISKEFNQSYNSYFTNIRTNFLNQESKRRIILGTFTRMAGFRNAYYLKAAKIRTLIINEYKKIFKKYDLLLSPTMPCIAPEINKIKEMKPIDSYKMDILTVGPNLAGLPHISVPTKEHKGMPLGLMAISDHFKDNNVFEVFKNG